MKLIFVSAVVSLLLSSTLAAPSPSNSDYLPGASKEVNNALNCGEDSEPNGPGEKSFKKLNIQYLKWVKKTLEKNGNKHSCNAKTVQIRQEWGAMKKKHKLAYIKAVKCIYTASPLSKPADVPGARSRLDDFVAAHMVKTNEIHFNGRLYGWHRHFLYLYDQALRKECGYDGPTPYWDWTLTSKMEESPVFDGSMTSLGGNGEYFQHGNTYVTAFGTTLTLPAGTGGGCVKSGPFSDLVINLGVTPNITNIVTAPGTRRAKREVGWAHLSPIPPTTDSPPPTSRKLAARDDVPPALQYNPRCLTRDFNPLWVGLSTLEHLTHLMNCDDIICLEHRADGWEKDGDTPEAKAYNQQNIIHAAGHFAIGGLNNDPFVSPGDPAFWLHHGMFDRVWTVWQGQKNSRLTEVGGTQTPFNQPPSGPVTPSDLLYYGVNGNPIQLGDVGNTLSGPYCYFYA